MQTARTAHFAIVNFRLTVQVPLCWKNLVPSGPPWKTNSITRDPPKRTGAALPPPEGFLRATGPAIVKQAQCPSLRRFNVGAIK